MEHITLFTDILPEEQERMRVCFHAREIIFKNEEMIMEYSSSMMGGQCFTVVIQKEIRI